MLRKTTLAALALTSTFAASCGRAETGTAMPSQSPSAGDRTNTPAESSSGQTTPPPMSSTAVPTMRPPTAPPRTPTDLLPTDVIVGTVTTGGTGPCYAIQTDDGQRYALYSDAGTVLSGGATVRVWFKPVVADCGPGTSVRIIKVEVVR
jgi:hypothetical protein